MNFALTLAKLIVVEKSVPGNDNNPFQDYMYPHPDDHTTRFTWSIRRKRLTILSDTQIFFAGSSIVEQTIILLKFFSQIGHAIPPSSSTCKHENNSSYVLLWVIAFFLKLS